MAYEGLLGFNDVQYHDQKNEDRILVRISERSFVQS